MKILLCHESDVVRGWLELALAAAGHELRAADRPEKLVHDVENSRVLLCEAGRGKAAIRLLRERGFTGRAIVAGDGTAEELGKLADDEEADGSLALSPPEDLAPRFLQALRGKKRVLIIDDSELAATLLAGELEPRGFEVHYACDAESATSLILKRATRPDLVLLDINMPRVDGGSFCRFLKKNSLFRGIKVILCSGAAPEVVASVARECGADGFVLKDNVIGSWITEQID